MRAHGEPARRNPLSHLLPLILLIVPGLVRAETCPWLNAATAGGILGGAVTASVTLETANREDATCSFIRGRSQLRIEVMTMDTPRNQYALRAAQCSVEGAPLKAIGNEAVVCGGENSAQVVGRVRNKIFVILVNAADSPAGLREKVRSIAEQVAGTLF